MKKLLSTMLSLCIMGTSIFTVPFTTHGSQTQTNTQSYGEATYKGMVFKVYSDHAELTDYHYESYSELTIPSSINGIPVTTICHDAFVNTSYLDEIIIPDTVTTIGKDAFFEPDILTSPCSFFPPSIM